MGCPGSLTQRQRSRQAAQLLLVLGQQRRSNPDPPNADLPQVCLSSPNPLIFKAIAILFEETSQQFESGASGGRDVGEKAAEREGRKSRSESESWRGGGRGRRQAADAD